MTEEYALAFFDALRCVAYIQDLHLRDAMTKELLYINKEVYPGRAKTNISPKDFASAQADKSLRRQLPNS